MLPKGPMKVPNERMVFNRTCFAQLSRAQQSNRQGACAAATSCTPE